MQHIEQLVDEYQTPEATKELLKGVRLLLFIGVAGAGKDTLKRLFLATGRFHHIVSHTTRAPRKNNGVLEQDGQDYHFISLENASQMVRDKQFVEAKYVHGNIYGTSNDEFVEAKANQQTAITDIDIQGVREYLRFKPETHAVFLLPPSAKEWERRLHGRYGDSDEHHEEILKRLNSADRELVDALADDRFVVIVNDDLDSTVERIEGVLSGDIEATSQHARDIADELLMYIRERISTLDS